MKREGLKKGVYLLPNLFTTANLFCGFFSIIRSFQGDYELAAWIIGLAIIFDSLDGRVARMTKTQSEFGVEYDSLSDLTSFAMAPAILVFSWTLNAFGRFGWMAAFLYFACGALRLARFNVQAGSVEKKDFQGLPSPAAAACIASFVVFYHYLFGSAPQNGYFVLGMVFTLAVLMVTNVRYFSFKSNNSDRRTSFFVFVIFAGFLAGVASNPNVMLFVFAVTYVGAGLIGAIWRSPKNMVLLRHKLAALLLDRPLPLEIDPKQKSRDKNLNVVTIRPPDKKETSL